MTISTAPINLRCAALASLLFLLSESPSVSGQGIRKTWAPMFGKRSNSTTPSLPGSVPPSVSPSSRLVDNFSIGRPAYQATPILSTAPSGTLPRRHSAIHSKWPSSAPSLQPSGMPSHRPSTVSSSIASSMPSDKPSSTPSLSPSSSPLPSLSPSLAPSTTPTEACHDNQSYRSPLNSFDCSDHSDTDCFQWKYVGLSPADVEDLINNCPITCRIDCGSLFAFETNFTYLLLHVANFLAPDTASALEKASGDYLTGNILERNESSKFTLNDVKLLSQRMVVVTNSTRRRSLRTMQEDVRVDIEVTVAFRGFILSTSLPTVEMYLTDGIQTYGYFRALRFTNDPSLQYVEVSYGVGNGNTREPDPITVAHSNDGPSAWSIAVSAIVCIGSVAAAIVLFSRRHRESLPSGSEKYFDAQALSPAASTRSPLAKVLSFDSVFRYVSATGNPSNDSPICAGESSVLSSSKSFNKVSPTASQTSADSLDEEHPFTGIIPPMIVYDCIEGDDDAQSACSRSRRVKLKCVVPSKHVAATSRFRAALRISSRDTIDETAFVGLIRIAHSSDTEPTPGDEIDENVQSGETAINLKSASLSPAKQSLLGFRKSFDLPGATPTKDGDRGHSTHARRMSASAIDFSEATSPEATEKIGSEAVSPIFSVASAPDDAAHCTLSSGLTQSVCNISHHGQQLLSMKSSRFESSTADHDPEAGTELVFQASRIGKLGLVIRCTDIRGPVVIQVKDYSPLLGQVQAGDRILEIDGHATTGMTLHNVTKFMSGKIAQSSRWASVFRIIVRRESSLPHQVPTLQPDDFREMKPARHQRTSSRGSASTATLPCSLPAATSTSHRQRPSRATVRSVTPPPSTVNPRGYPAGITLPRGTPPRKRTHSNTDSDQFRRFF